MANAKDLFDMTGVMCLITGAGSGLGKAIAEGYSELGASLMLVDRDEESLSTTAETLGAEPVIMDITEPSEMARLETRLADRDPLDVLVNAAGVGGRSAAAEYPTEVWDRAIAINLTGTFRMCQLVGTRMTKNGQGSIINFASIGGLVGYPGSVGYQASKGGVVQVTRTLAVEWAPHGVRVNAIAPSQFETPIVRRQWEKEPELGEFFLNRTPLARFGQPGEIVGPAVFLATQASAMVTGHILTVDGGYTAQ